jgi:nitrogen fixation protein NifU and related proteins
MFSPQILDYFEHPRHAGEIEDPDIVVERENPACGDVLRLTVRVREGRIAEARFRAKGCVAAMACASWLAEQMAGRNRAELSRLRREELVEALGGLRAESQHASHLAMDALQAMLQDPVLL